MTRENVYALAEERVKEMRSASQPARAKRVLREDVAERACRAFATPSGFDRAVVGDYRSPRKGWRL